LIAIIAYADPGKDSMKTFQKRIASFQKSCDSRCHLPFSERRTFDLSDSESSKIDKVTRSGLAQIAYRLAQVWGDTILEGDYYADGTTQLDQVFALYENEILLGYRITYSEHAWYVGDCEFSYDNLESLANCTEGRIRESGFVSPSFEEYFQDENNFAEFVN
jgi:hypothetical protein